MDITGLNPVNRVTIRNFKSVKSVTLDDCRRINVLIGRPNVGKSNILEALALFDVPYMVSSSGRSLKRLVRVDNTADLFHNGISASPAEVIAGGASLSVTRNSANGLTVSVDMGDGPTSYIFAPSLALTTRKEPQVLPGILAYFFPRQLEADASTADSLIPPSGSNLMETVASLPRLKDALSGLFHQYGLKMVFDAASRQIKAMKETGSDIFLIPFTSLADSLQRLIFYKAAILSNHGKVICFEEPEAHTFPPYITSVVNDMIASRDNQFFITTHSPYILGSLLEEAGADLAVYVVDMAENATVTRRLDDASLQAAYDSGLDFFYNIEAYTPQ